MEDSGGSAMIRLTDKNWVTWKPRMEGILYCKDLHEPIEGDEAKPEEMTEKQWYIQNRKAIGTIIKWVDDSVFCHVAKETNAHKLWTKLEVMFEKKAVTKKYFMIKDLVNMKYKEDMNMTVHLNNFHNIINQLATMGMVLEDELQALLFLSSLPDGWETFVVTLSDSAANGVLSVDFVKDSMQKEETRKKNSGVCTEQTESDNQKMEDDKNPLVVVHFRALERPKEDEFCIELAKNHTYDDVVERVAQHLGLDDPSKIWLTPHNCYSQQPKPNPIKRRSVDRLLDMLFHYNQISDILYYEVLDIPLPELQCLKTLKVAFHHATKDEAVVLNIRLPRQSTVGDMLNEIKTKVELSHPNAELRLLEVFCHKIYKIFPPNEKIENINDQYWTLRAEEIPEEEKNLGPNSRLINVYHFTKENAQNQVQVQSFGEPLFLVNHDGETLADVKIRIQKKLQVPDEEFSKWKFAFLSLGHPEYLEDSDIVSSHFQRRDVYGAWVQYIVVEHSDAPPKRSCTANQMRMKRKQEEKEAKRIYKEAPLCRIIEVARDEDLKEQIGKDIYFDLVDHDKVRSFIIQKQTPFNHFKEEVAREFGIPVEFQRFWMWAKRKNLTYRPLNPLTPYEEAQTVGALREISNQAHNAELKLFLEVYHGQDLHPVPPPVKNEDDILLFFKLYDPEKEELRYVGRFFVKSSSKTMEILVKLNELAGFAPDEEIELFEEINFEPSVMCVRLDKEASFRFSQIENGDIICFQKKLLPGGEEKFRYPDVPSFLEYVKNRQKRRKFEKPLNIYN